MFIEPMLRKQPALIHAFTGVSAEAFWGVLETGDCGMPEELVIPPSGELPNGRVLVGVTKQRIPRYGKDNTTRTGYFSDKKKTFRLKIQIVVDNGIYTYSIYTAIVQTVCLLANAQIHRWQMAQFAYFA